MRNLIVTVDITYPRSVYGHSARATVTASIPGVCIFKSHGFAGGWGYDKASAAACEAFNNNPLLETFALWREFVPTVEYYNDVIQKRDYGYKFRFDGRGLSMMNFIMKANGFNRESTHSDDSDNYIYTRNVPESFIRTI